MTDTPTSTVVNSREPSRPNTPTALSTPPSTVTVGDKPQDDSSRLKLFLGLLRKYVQWRKIGVLASYQDYRDGEIADTEPPGSSECLTWPLCGLVFPHN